MQYLKALVIGMGILIVLGMALLVYGFTAKSKGKAPKPDNVSVQSTNDVFGTINLDLSPMCGPESITAENNRLIVEIGPRTFPECAKILVLDMNTGKTLGTMELHKQ